MSVAFLRQGSCLYLQHFQGFGTSIEVEASLGKINNKNNNNKKKNKQQLVFLQAELPYGLVQLHSILEAWKILVLPRSWKYRMPRGGASSKLVWFVNRSDIYPDWTALPRCNAFGTPFLEPPSVFFPPCVLSGPQILWHLTCTSVLGLSVSGEGALKYLLLCRAQQLHLIDRSCPCTEPIVVG